MLNAAEISTTLAEAYAEALTPLAGDAGVLDDVLAELEQTARLSAEIGFDAWCDSPLVPAERKAEAIEAAFRGRVSDLTCDTLGVIVRHGRMPILGSIVEAFRRRALAETDRVLVDVTTAHPLDDDSRERLSRALAERFAAEPVLREHIDESIIGGLVVRRGDEVLDLSVESEMEQINRKIARWLDRMQTAGDDRPGLEADSEA